MSSFTAPLITAMFGAAIGSAFPFGLALGSLNMPEAVMRQWINETYFERYGVYQHESSSTLFWAIVVSIFAVAGAFGGVLTSTVAKSSLGRRNGLLLTNISAFVGAVLVIVARFSKIYELLIASRIFTGFSSGLGSGLAPMYLSEIAPKEIRGAVGTIFQLFLTIGILVGQLLGLDVLFGGDRWWLLLGFPLVPIVIQYILLPISPKSPKFLYIDRGDKHGAQRALRRLRRSENVDSELRELEHEAEQKKYERQVSMKELFGNRFLRSVLVIAVMMMVAQQLSGINAAIFYSSSIFSSAGLSKNTATAATIGMGAVNVAMTIVSMIIVDKAGRRALLLIGFSGMCAMTVLLTFSTLYAAVATWIAYMAIVAILLLVIAQAIGPGPIPWFLVTELFTSNARANATTVAVVTNWVCTMIVGFAFPLLVPITREYTFLIFTALLVFFIAYIYKYVPETRGKKIEEIQRELHGRYGPNTSGITMQPVGDNNEASRRLYE